MTDRSGERTTLVLAAGVTRTAEIPGISAAGADPTARRWTPTADAEILRTGTPTDAPTFPRSPSGCPTPAVVTRAVRELVGFDAVVVDGGLAESPGVDVRDVGATPGGDIRDETPVPDTPSIVERARAVGADVDADRVLVAETIPGGTTTAMGVLAALGERTAVSSSLPDNPVERKRAVVDTGLGASDVDAGSLAGDPLAAVRCMGDPVLATLAGLVGGLDDDTSVTLAGGTQLAALGALLRHLGVERELRLATTSYVADDDSATVETLATDLDLDLRVTDPGFEDAEAGLDRIAAGEAKEGVGMGGALALASAAGISSDRIEDRAVTVVNRCLAEAR
jgi:uncharacterized protein (TIGR00303 family)